MKKFFKFLPIVFAVLMCFCLAFAACAADPDTTDGGNNQTSANGSGNGNNNGDNNDENGGSGSSDSSSDSSSEQTGASGDVLVVYFSATNNTEKIAGYIADITGATQFELVPQDPYTDADLRYNDGNSRVSKEHNDESLRNVPLVDVTPDNWEDYNTVFVGYPIWWGSAAWPVNGFIKGNDFTGKTVVPFCTSASSPLGNSDTQLKEMAGTGEWKAGKRFSSSASKDDVEDWIESLDITFGRVDVAETTSLTYELNAEKDGYIVTGESAQAANIVIPAAHEGKPVVAIADSAFAYSKHTSDILSVIIPDSVVEIGKNAFYNQDALVTVEIGEGSKLEKIGNNAFSGNYALQSVYLPASLTSLGDSVFNNCGGLNTIEVAAENSRYSGEGNCLIDLDTGTLIRGSNQSEIPAAVTKIGEAAFRKATLTTLTIPAGVKEIDKYAIQNSAIEKIIYKGSRAEWEEVLKASHKNWNMGKTNVEVTCADDNA